MKDGKRRYKGREYVTCVEFARRVGSTRQTVYNRLKKGLLQGVHIDGSKEIWLDWEAQKRQWTLRAPQDGRPVGSRNSPGKSVRGAVSPAPIRRIEKPRTPQAEVPSVPSIASMDEKVRGDDIIDLSRIDPEDHKDCWLLDKDCEPIRSAATGEPLLDYDRLKLKLTSITYQLDIDEKRGKLVAKEELTRSMMAISSILANGLQSIPRRYSSIMVAYAERISGHRFTPDEKAGMQELLKDAAASIIASIRAEVSKLEEDGDD